ncbi:MAG: 30S ribosome-binding factor RbfA [Burkholderiaceae bacterium]
MKRQQNTNANRSERVAQQLHQEVAAIVRGELKDPRIGMVTITGVDLTPDYAYLTVYFSVLPDDEETVAKTTEGLLASAGYVRSKIGRRVRIHTTPDVRFVQDVSTAHGMAMSQLIDQALRTGPAGNDKPDSAENSDATGSSSSAGSE